MSKLTMWNNVEQKRQAFVYSKIDTKTDLNSFFQHDDPGWVYRGLTEAKYKLYSSAQREWFGKELNNHFLSFHDFVKGMISEAKKTNNGFIPNILSKLGPNSNDLAILSFLQHYGAPTPLLDFTESREIALFFAADGASYNPSDDIANYISVYGIPPINDRPSFRSAVQCAKRRLEEMSLENPDIDTSTIGQLDTYDDAIQWKIIIINDNDASKDDYKIGINSNINIIAQKGLFILNVEVDKTLDYFFDGVMPEDSNNEIQSRLFYGKIHCWDIHKSLLESISNQLKSLNICNATVYPENKQISKQAYINVLI